MANLFNSLGNNQQFPTQNIFQKYQEFRRMFRGDPQQIIQQKLQSGEISQQQLEQAKAMMSQFSQYFK